MKNILNSPIKNLSHQWMIFICVFIGLGALLSIFSYVEHQRVERQEIERLGMQVETLRRNIEPQLEMASRVIDGVIKNISFSQESGLPRINQLKLVELNHALLGLMRPISVVNASGVILASSDPGSVGDSIAKNSYFQNEINHPQENILHISAPHSIPSKSAQTISLFKTLLDRNGNFFGMVVVTLSPDFFSTLLSSVHYTSDIRSTIIHGNGILLHVEPEWVTSSGIDLAKGNTFFARHKNSGLLTNTYIGQSKVTGEARVVLLKNIQPKALNIDQPLVVTVSRSLRAIFEPWRKSVYIQIAAFSVIFLISAWVMAFMLRWRRSARICNQEVEKALQRVNRAFITLSACNEEFIHAEDENTLLQKICQVIVENGGYHMAWVGIPQQDLGLTIKPIAHFGFENHYLTEMKFSWSKYSDSGQGPTGKAIRSHEIQVNQNFESNPLTHPWRTAALERSYRSSISLPLKNSGTIFGVLNIYASEIDAFSDAEKELLEKLAANLSFGISAIRGEAERNEAEEKLSIAAVAFESQEGIMIADSNQYIVNVNKAFTEITGYTAEEAIGKKASLLKSGHHDGEFYDSIKKSLHQNDGWQGKIWNKRKSGELYLEWLIITAVKDRLGMTTHYVGTFTDITNRYAMEEELHIAAVAFESQEAVIVSDPNRIILRVNKAFTCITGYTQEEAAGKHPAELLESKRDDDVLHGEMNLGLKRAGSWQGEIWNRHKDGNLYPIWLQITAVKNETDEVTHHVSTFTDMSERKRAEEKIHHLAFYDSLTNLPNRRLLLDRLDRGIASTARTQQFGAVLFLDLDNFKNLNDTLGHDIGDQLLKQVGLRLSSSVRGNDTVARLGGDEFVVLLEGLGRNQSDAAEWAESVGRKILRCLSQPYQIGAYPCRSSPSIGITIFSGHRKDTLENILKQADLAMYQAKSAGRNTMQFFDKEMQSTLTARTALESDLRTALELNQFQLYYQSQVDADDNVIGAEALLRLAHPIHGVISPDKFIDLAEDTGLILPIGNWVLNAACEQLAAWAAHPALCNLTLAVNISAHEFYQSDFIEKVLESVRRAHVNPNKLKLELTESLMHVNIEDTIAKMLELNLHGITFSLDDFGTGYSSLSYLKSLPVRQLKIDKSFINELPQDPSSCAISCTIIGLAQSLGISVIAEGIETGEQRNFLIEKQCNAFQGYLFSPPLPLSEFISYVESWDGSY